MSADLDMIIFITTLIVNSILLCLVIIKQCKNPRNPICLSFIASIVFLLLWTVFNYMADASPNYASALFYTRATIPAASAMVVYIFIFASIFPITTENHKVITKIYAAVLSVFSILAMTPAVIASITFVRGAGVEDVKNTFLFFPIVLLYFWILGHALFILYKKYGVVHGKHKEQIRYTLIGWGLFLLAAIIVSAVLPLVLGDARLSELGPLSSIFMVGFTTYAILKHQFLDIRIVIQRGLIYLILLGITIGMYIASLELIAVLVHKITNITTIASAGFTMILGAFFMRPLGDYFRKVTDPIFFKDKYDYAEALHMLSKILHTRVTETDIIASSSELLKKIFKATEATFYQGTDCAQKIVSSPTCISIPVIFEDKCVGILTLGPKRSGDAYTQTDIRLLQTFAYQAAVALEKGRLYDKVKRYNADLEETVEERTKEIKRLQEDQKQAMIDISHNLQTPLAVIRGELELLNELEDTSKIETVKKSIDRVSGFIRQMLHLARLEHSVYAIELSPMDLSTLVRDHVEYFKVMAKESDVRIVFSASQSIMIRGHKRFLGELLTNLVSNAIIYRNANRKSVITIHLFKTTTNAILNIEDNGIGIAEEDLPEIFTRFYRGSRARRAENDSSDQQPGTGLGLAICKKIVEKHNGTLGVQSVLGEKTAFTITLPLVKR